MINNAGLMPRAPLERLKIEEWNRTIDVNIKGVLHPRGAAAHEEAESGVHVAFAMSQPEEVDVNEILFRPTRQEL